MDHTVYFGGLHSPVRVPTGALLSEAARLAGLQIGQPCGGKRIYPEPPSELAAVRRPV